MARPLSYWIFFFFHLSFSISAAVINATRGSLLCLGNQGVLSTGKQFGGKKTASLDVLHHLASALTLLLVWRIDQVRHISLVAPVISEILVGKLKYTLLKVKFQIQNYCCCHKYKIL